MTSPLVCKGFCVKITFRAGHVAVSESPDSGRRLGDRDSRRINGGRPADNISVQYYFVRIKSTPTNVDHVRVRVKNLKPSLVKLLLQC
eukprot:g39187.t1